MRPVEDKVGSIKAGKDADMVIFFNRDGKWVERPLPSDEDSLPPLPTEAYEEGRNAAPGYDIHALENDWRDFWESSGKPKIDNPAAAFVGFCRSRHKRAPIRREVYGDADEPPARTRNRKAR